MQVDPQFRQSRAASKRRQRQRRIQVALISVGILGCAGLVAGVGYWLFQRPETPVAEVAAEQTDEVIVQVDTDNTAPAVRVATPFVDLAGDPMILRFDNSGSAGGQQLAGPSTLDPQRFGPPVDGRLSLVVEDLVVQESRLITALPSSREDFAFFQAQRSQSLEIERDVPALITNEILGSEDAEPETVTVADGEASWGQTLGEDGENSLLTYVNTRIQNTTSIAFVKPEADRQPVSRDLVVRFVRPRAVDEFLKDNGFSEQTAKDVGEAALTLLPDAAGIATDGLLPTGTIIAVRYRPVQNDPVPLQVTIYGPDGYLGTLARRGTTGYQVGSNPWIDADLPKLATPVQDFAPQPQDYRLLDAVYSAAIRSGMPTTLVGELIVMLSKAYDLEAFAAPGDKVTLLYSQSGRSGPGQIAFAGISGPSGDMPCYVAPKADSATDEFACYTPRGLLGGGASAGFVTPVEGTLTSPYGPRFHPIHKRVLLHGGVDWAAPTGTPIVAALDGTIDLVGNGGGYGNVIYINHADGMQSRYAHLDSFAPSSRKGAQVRAGQLIGFVGTTGNSTGPHLHFEIRKNGAPIDPFSLGQSSGTLVASNAVEALTDQIIKVESAGNANAKNPLSTATGLGQFIESTWLRMMRDYRPDLTRTMSKPELLALRTDPTLSREMVQNLARENENFLRGKGHRVDAGRLYLAHFLGPGGANTVLSSPDDATILAVMGAGVVRANPFLKNYTVADLKAWAQRKMRGAGTGGGGTPVPTQPRISPAVKSYMDAIDGLLEQAI